MHADHPHAPERRSGGDRRRTSSHPRRARRLRERRYRCRRCDLQPGWGLRAARHHVHVEPLREHRGPDAVGRLRGRAGRAPLREPVHHAAHDRLTADRPEAGGRPRDARRLDAAADLHAHEHRKRRHRRASRPAPRWRPSLRLEHRRRSGVERRRRPHAHGVRLRRDRRSARPPQDHGLARRRRDARRVDDPAVRLPPGNRRRRGHPAGRQRARLQRRERRPRRGQPVRRHSQPAVERDGCAWRERRARKLDALRRREPRADRCRRLGEHGP